MAEVFDQDPNAPWNNEEKENECSFCREPSEGSFCSRDCERADYHENRAD